MSSIEMSHIDQIVETKRKFWMALESVMLVIITLTQVPVMAMMTWDVKRLNLYMPKYSKGRQH